VLNTTGRARLLGCRSCRAIQRCQRCDAAVAQRDDRVLECRRCATTRPPVCPVCGSSALANVRPGVTRAREEIEAAAARPVVAVTATTAALDATAGVFVGTEAVLHRVAHAEVVAFLDLDGELLAPRYRAAEQAMALLVRAARLVGARGDGGRIILQTMVPDHEVVQAVLHTDPGRLARVEAARRRDLQLPPYAALAAVSGPGADDFVAATALRAAAGGDVHLLRAARWDELGPVLAATPRPRGSRVRVEVDPPRV
jgi:primosomal protein N' (replication factor Y)